SLPAAPDRRTGRLRQYPRYPRSIPKRREYWAATDGAEFCCTPMPQNATVGLRPSVVAARHPPRAPPAPNPARACLLPLNPRARVSTEARQATRTARFPREIQPSSTARQLTMLAQDVSNLSLPHWTTLTTLLIGVTS